MSNFKFGIRNQCIFLAIYSAVILLFASAMSHGGRITTVTLYVSACEARGLQHSSAAEPMRTGTWVNHDRLNAKAVQSRV